MTAPMTLNGAMTGDAFRSYIGQVLGPTLRRGDIVVMDNVPLHRTQAVREALERLGVSVPTFPAYSPDLNPIEQAIAKLKAHLRKLAPRSPQRLTAALRDGLQQFTPAECLIPDFDGAVFSREWKEALWAKFSTAAPQRLRQSVERYSIVKRA